MLWLRKSVRMSALSLVLASIAGAALATPITYNVNFSIGTAVAIGTIQTDGTLGPITSRTIANPAHILDWSLTVSDPTNT